MTMNRLLIIAVSAVLAACGQQAPAPAAPPSHAALCASPATIAEVKAIVFENAAKAAAGNNKLALPDLAQQTTATLQMPVLDSFDSQTQKTSCAGQLHLSLPTGAVTAMGGAQDLTADIKYTAQPAADGSGTVYSVLGAGDIIQGLSEADLSVWAQRLQPAVTSASASTARPDDMSRGSKPPPVGEPSMPPRAPETTAPATAVVVNPDAEICAHGNPNTDRTIEACSRQAGIAGAHE
jgi:hypothetical protein